MKSQQSARRQRSRRAEKSRETAPILRQIGIVFLGIGLTIFAFIYTPIIFQEVHYRITPPAPSHATQAPIDTSFGIVIPKIGANASIIANVDPFDPRAYQYALSRGVAHAKGTSLPDETGDIFLFSHSSVNFFEAARYNSIFYLLNKIEVGDTITLYYLQNKYTYVVTGTKIVNPKDVQYLSQRKNADQTLTLMTCWPAGTSFRRLLVFAKRVE